METYKTHIENYKRALAVGDFARAKAAIAKAIELCECDEALPTLSALYADVRAKAHPSTWLKVCRRLGLAVS